MKIEKFIQAHHTNYTKGRTQAIKYIVLHYVGADGSAPANLNYFAGAGREASANYFIAHAKTGAGVYQSVKEEDTAWNCGTKGTYKHTDCRNSNSLSIELCCHKDKQGRWYFDTETVDTALKLVKDLMKKYNIGVDCVLRHFDVTGKNCPAPWVESPSQWLTFKEGLVVKTTSEKQEEVFNNIKIVEVYDRVEDLPTYSQQTIQKLISKGYLNGDSKGLLGLTIDMVRVFIVNDRAGLYDR